MEGKHHNCVETEKIPILYENLVHLEVDRLEPLYISFKH